ncbi:MAG: excinuclease ABC subunit UvrC [Desulfovibrio sp.]|jgi:excinuclease ABC subunit C|nr:excinuclease ABC subunit UvrC [Desulfovibrio sp.]
MQKPDLALFPTGPGVYLYKDAAGHILYIGKAGNLRQRLASYFRAGAALPVKTRVMLDEARHIDILRTGTEKEALLLEAGLIKKHHPRFNIVLRDDKEYLLIRIARGHPYPKVEIVRRSKHGNKSAGAKLFGPFSSGQAARDTLRLIHKNFPLRRCRDAAFANRTRPCLYHDMGQCLAPCVMPVPPKTYRGILDQVQLLLSGKTRKLVSGIKREMDIASRELHFEKAAALRDQIRSLEKTVERQSVVLDENTDLDIVGPATVPEGAALGLLVVRGGLLQDGRNFFWPGLAPEDAPDLLDDFLTQYYAQSDTYVESIPPRIVVPRIAGNEEESFHALERALSELRGRPVRIARPSGPDENSLILMAESNARTAAAAAARKPAAGQLQQRFQATKPVRRIEVVDISHISGSKTRAGMAVFEDERPVFKAYRVYNLDADPDAAGTGDDYAALAAWAGRRIADAAEQPFPDLMLIDGGKGQLAAVFQVFNAANIKTGNEQGAACILASIAKARNERGGSDRRAGNTADRIFVPGRGKPLNFPPGCPELLYLQRVRDAAHKFAVRQHRKARSAAAFTGRLAGVRGIGPRLTRALYKHFGSLPAMQEAGEQQLAEVPGIGKGRAAAVIAALAAENNTDSGTQREKP